MSNKEKKNKNVEIRSSKVLPINLKVGKYQEAFDLYRKHPSIPTFLFLLDQALAIGVNFQTLEPELSHLIDIDDDQYFGVNGSKYYRHNYQDLEEAIPFRQNVADALSICASLWKFFEKISTEQIWGYENFFVGMNDYIHLHSKKNENALNNQEENALKEDDSERQYLLSESSGKLLTEAVVQQPSSAKTISDLANRLGRPLVPWAAWVYDNLPSRSNLLEGIQDLSKYLASYYVALGKSDFTETEFTAEPRKIDHENARSLARIAEFLIFSRLFKKMVYKDSSFDIANFYRERIEYLSDRNALIDHESQAEYIIAISNLLMICAKLGISSAEEGIVSDQELARKFLDDIESEYLDLAALSTLPLSGFAQILGAINPYEGDRFDNYCVSKALRVANYGLTLQWDPDLFDEMFEDAFSGIDQQVLSFLHPRIKRAARGWLIPFQHTRNIWHIYNDFWSDRIITQKISDAIFELDKKNITECKFIIEDLENEAIHYDPLDESYHPVIFSRKFSNKVDFVDFKDDEWIKFGWSLVKAGQVRHACTVMALNINIVGINIFFNLGLQKNFNVPAVMRLLNHLSGYSSFLMIREAIADFFEIVGEVDPIYEGSLKEFLPAASGKLVSIKSKVEEDFEQHTKSLLSAGLIVTRLSKEARDNLLKGYTLARSKDLPVFNFSGDAVRNYVLAVEGELRSRAPDIDRALAEELKYLNVDVDWRNRIDGSGRGGVFRGLVSICRILEVFSKLSAKAQEKLTGFKALAMHREVDLFRNSMREFTNIRNTVQHPDGRGPDPGASLARVEELMFGNGGLVRILCETR